jgi:SAM-dependent methyltransferase
LRELAGATWDALLQVLPSRRKAAFGDLDYDWEHFVDTTRSNASVGTQFFTGITARPYFATEPWLFEQIMQALALSIQQSALSIQPATAVRETGAYTGLQEFNFIDLGSGKGRVLLMASDYPFKRIVGVEFMPGLHRAAQQNISVFASDRQLCRQIETLCMDARDFQFPPGPLVVYLFNPFAESAFAQVLENLRCSVEESPRPIYIAYRFKEFENLLAQAAWLEKVDGTEQWAVYRAR